MSFTMEYDGKVLPIRVEDVGGRGPLSQNIIRATIPNRAGSTYKKKSYPERPLPVSFSILDAQSLPELRELVDSLSLMLDVEEPKPTIFSDEPSKIYYSIIDGAPDWEEIKYYGKGVLPFVSLDARKYGESKTISSSIVTNEGGAPCDGVFTIDFSAAASELRIQNEEGKYVRIIWAFAAGDKLEIDFKKRKVTINYIVRMTSLDFKSTWFVLKPGENKLEVTPDGVADVSVTYTPRWL